MIFTSHLVLQQWYKTHTHSPLQSLLQFLTKVVAPQLILYFNCYRTPNPSNRSNLSKYTCNILTVSTRLSLNQRYSNECSGQIFRGCKRKEIMLKVALTKINPSLSKGKLKNVQQQSSLQTGVILKDQITSIDLTSLQSRNSTLCFISFIIRLSWKAIPAIPGLYYQGLSSVGKMEDISSWQLSHKPQYLL